MALATTDSKDGCSYSGAVSASVITFSVVGGKYVWGTSAADTSQELDCVLPSGDTLKVAALTTAAAWTAYDLPAGTYKLTFSTTTAVEGFVQKVPYLPV